MSATGVLAASPGFLLGVGFSEWLSSTPAQIATDSSGAVYILSTGQSSTVTKLSADGTTLVWQNQLGFVVQAMAVDPTGGVYVVPFTQSGVMVTVSKLSAGGTGLAWTISSGFVQYIAPVLAADAQGRAYVSAGSIVTNSHLTGAYVVRINASGTAIDYTAQVMGEPTSIAVDASGAALLAGYVAGDQGPTAGFLALLAPDGSAGFYSTLPADQSQAVAVDGAGNVAVFGNGVLTRVDSTGAVTLSTTVGGGAFALDAAGNAYINGGNPLTPNHSLATCNPVLGSASSAILTVVSPAGSILQSTYIPGSASSIVIPPAIGANSSVFFAAIAGSGFTPTQPGPFPVGAAGGAFLTELSQNAAAPTDPLVCIFNSASLGASPIAPGELVTLLGNGLGPALALSGEATTDSPYPTQLGGTQVTFDGTPAPLLFVEDTQINAVAPWSLAPGQNSQVCVTYNNSPTNCLTWPVTATSPGVFRVYGSSYAAALNQDGSVNSADRPAPVGSIVTVFATGLGPITPPQGDGTLITSPVTSNALSFGVVADSIVGFPPPPLVPLNIVSQGPVVSDVAGVSAISFQIVSYPSYGAIFLTQGPSLYASFQLYVAGQ
jgi:uncharacterized protein (TIGR03437 family)